MENKIDIAKLLKDCPKGMELDCTVWEKLYFEEVTNADAFPISCYFEQNGVKIPQYFTKYGCYHSNDNAKCIIFPKDKTTWKGFIPPCKFKDGDILTYMFDNKPTIFIYKNNGIYNTAYYVAYSSTNKKFFISKDKMSALFGNKNDLRFATEEEKQGLFSIIIANGYTWNAEKKILEKLSERFKDGDILSDSLGTCIFKGEGVIKGTVDYYCCAFNDHFIVKQHPEGHCGNIANHRLATKEEKERLFKAIKDNNYKWNPDTKTLEKLPKFKIGDRIKSKTNQEEYTITDIRKNVYVTKTFGYLILFSNEDNYELISNKFDITTLIPFKSRVLFRNSLDGYWKPAFWGKYIPENSERHQNHDFLTTKGFNHYCIPYEGNEHLMGTQEDCHDFYKTWE